MDLAEWREMGPSLPLALSPDPDVLSHDPEGCPGASSAHVENAESLGSGLE